jgi:hypothetical protein
LSSIFISVEKGFGVFFPITFPILSFLPACSEYCDLHGWQLQVFE